MAERERESTQVRLRAFFGFRNWARFSVAIIIFRSRNCGRFSILKLMPNGSFCYRTAFSRRLGRGGSHVIFSAHGVREIVTVPAKRPIKPVYIKYFLALVDAVGDIRTK